ncbi:unnamed protein product [Coffea canephora]|uniref:Uncharacterized protein n=1 Tax=Coffea canephora TaxID=49390 RepID=A0A068V9P8_COFCA|nr:unnamed protein product [Coffea canephora]
MASTTGVFGNRCRALMAAAKSSVASTTSGSAAAKTSGRRNGILKKQPVSPTLRQFVGAPCKDGSGSGLHSNPTPWPIWHRNRSRYNSLTRPLPIENLRARDQGRDSIQ